MRGWAFGAAVNGFFCGMNLVFAVSGGPIWWVSATAAIINFGTTILCVQEVY